MAWEQEEAERWPAPCLAWGGMWSPPQVLPIKQSWHFSARQRRWLLALEVSIWPLSQHCPPGPSPLTLVDPDRGPQQAIVIWPAPQWGHSGVSAKAPLGALPPPPPGCPWPQPSPVWVGGLAVVKAASRRGNITEDWIVDRGYGNAPHVTRPQDTLPTWCPCPIPPWGSKGPAPDS